MYNKFKIFDTNVIPFDLNNAALFKQFNTAFNFGIVNDLSALFSYASLLPDKYWTGTTPGMILNISNSVK